VRGVEALGIYDIAIVLPVSRYSITVGYRRRRRRRRRRHSSSPSVRPVLRPGLTLIFYRSRALVV